jgi:uncharacterized protein involved in exopolysaccharide biosynthesis
MLKRFRWILLALLAVGALLGFLAAAVVTYVMPKKYESRAVLQIPAHPDASPVDMAAEVAMVERSVSLEQVIDTLDLTSRWILPKQEALDALRKCLTITRADGGKRITVRCEHTSREDARDIAEGVSSIYQKTRAESSLRAKEQAIGGASKAVLDVQVSIEQGKEALSGYVGGLGKDGRDISEVKSKLDSDQKLLDELMKKRVELAAMIPPEVTVVEKPVISQIPCSPKVTENLVTGTAAGTVFLPLLGAMALSLLKRRS